MGTIKLRSILFRIENHNTPLAEGIGMFIFIFGVNLYMNICGTGATAFNLIPRCLWWLASLRRSN